MCLAVPGRVEDVEPGDARVGRVDFGGIQRRVSLAFVPEARVGDYVLVHVGVAISRVDEAEARKVFEALARMGALAAELEGEEQET